MFFGDLQLNGPHFHSPFSLSRLLAALCNVMVLYSVPFEEDEKDSSVWFLDHNYHEAMYDMFKKVNGKEADRLVNNS